MSEPRSIVTAVSRSARAVAAEVRFRTRVAELGGSVLGPYVNSKTPVLARCGQGHDCWPHPESIRLGRGICRVCAGTDPAQAAEAFRSRAAELGLTLLGPYVGNKVPVPGLCPQGHKIRVWSATLQRGGSVCGICTGRHPQAAEAAFAERVASLGGVMLGTYVNNHTRTLVRCTEGHESSPLPMTVMAGGGICRTCAGRDTSATEAAFRARVAECGGVLLAPYRDARVPVAARCKDGHDCRPRPDHVLEGIGICHKCAHREWDVFYVLTSATRVKFGITSGDARPRLTDHRKAGYTTVVRLVTGLPGRLAPDTERAVKSALADAGENPVQGTEHFDISCLALILDVADGWLTASAA